MPLSLGSAWAVVMLYILIASRNSQWFPTGGNQETEAQRGERACVGVDMARRQGLEGGGKKVGKCGKRGRGGPAPPLPGPPSQLHSLEAGTGERGTGEERKKANRVREKPGARSTGIVWSG